jgi:hypothetical protein
MSNTLLEALILFWGVAWCAGCIFLLAFPLGRLFDCIGRDRMTLAKSVQSWWKSSKLLYKLSGILGIPAIVLTFYLEAVDGGRMFSKTNGDYLGRLQQTTIMTQRAYDRMLSQIEFRNVNLYGSGAFPIGKDARLELFIEWRGTTNEEQRIAFTKYAVIAKYPDGREVESFVRYLLYKDPEVMSNLSVFITKRAERPRDYDINDELKQFATIAQVISEPLKKFDLSVKTIKLQPACGCP